jgi:hypothetical protein
MQLVMMSTVTVLIGAAAMVTATTAAKPGDSKRAPLLTAVTQCRTVLDSAARLACFDESVAALDRAESDKAVVVIDRQQVREARRSLFGIGLPATGLFGGDNVRRRLDLRQIIVAAEQAGGASSWRTVHDGRSPTIS